MLTSITLLLISLTQLCILAITYRLKRQMDILLFNILELQNMMMANFGNGSTKVMDTVTTSLGDNEKEPDASS